MRLDDKEQKKDIKKRLDEIDKMTGITRSQKARLLNELSEISLNLQYKRKHLSSVYDDSNYHGLKD